VTQLKSTTNIWFYAKIQAAIVVFGLACSSACLADEEPQPVQADTLLVLKNGAEVRGLFVSLKEGKYTIRLPDGRAMTYEAADVEHMERLAVPAPNTAPAPPPASQAPAMSSCGIFLSEKEIDKSFYTTVREVEVYHGWYGSAVELYGALAKKAQSVGADAVINVHTWHSPKGFSWAAPHAAGMAIKWTSAGRAALPGLEGRCY
jgi:hypothetical protein